MTKHIYKYSLETTFFQILISPNGLEKVVRDGKPALTFMESDGSVICWLYEVEEHRDNDFDVIKFFELENEEND